MRCRFWQVGVARHLATIPGHKDPVWITSDNVLADWTDKAGSSDKSRQHIGGFVLRAQEAPSDAHVSIYPLDASQLETQAIDASLQTATLSGPRCSRTAAASMSGPRGRPLPWLICSRMFIRIQVAIQEMAAADRWACLSTLQ